LFNFDLDYCLTIDLIQLSVCFRVLISCAHGDLETLIKKRKAESQFIDEVALLQMLVQMLLALQYLHSKKILHRDIKVCHLVWNQQIPC
jgi:serine/threonine protein kinase